MEVKVLATSSKIESGTQLFSRVKAKPHLEQINKKLFPDESLQQNSVIEITGSDGIEKFKLLINFVIRCILPPTFNEEWRDCGVIFINTDHQVTVLVIIKAISEHLKQLNVKMTNAILEKALKNLTIVNCFNNDQFEMSIFNLERVINSSGNQSLLVIDNIAPYYWNKRFQSNMLSTYRLALQNFDRICDIIKDMNVMLVFVRNDVNESKKFSVHVDFRVQVHVVDDGSCNAMVTNYLKNTKYSICYRSEKILTFLI